MRFYIALLLCFVPLSSIAAKPSSYPADRFKDDRYEARSAQAVSCPPPFGCPNVIPVRPSKAKHRRTKSRRVVPLPRERPGTVARLTMAGGFGRELRRASRPRAWCGWWLSHHLGIARRDLWLARNWASVGRPAGGPQIGAIVVWRHHVGIITGRAGGKWIVKSGNDGHAVRERPRSLAGAIAFRFTS